MEDRFNSVSEGELVDDLLLALLEVHLPSVFAVRLWKLHETVVLLLAKVVEEVLVEASVLDVVGSDLQDIAWVSWELVSTVQHSAKLKFQGCVNSPPRTKAGITHPKNRFFAELFQSIERVVDSDEGID